MKELISVVVPIYNVEKYLDRCVKSILEQTYTNLEVILVDDESPDNCPAMCEEYAKNDARVKVIHQKNKGLSGARNAGIDIAKGEYIAFVDSDDYITNDFIEVLYNACIVTGSEIAQCKYQYVEGNPVDDTKDCFGKETQEKSTGGLYSYTGKEMISNMYIPDGAYFVVAWNKLYKASIFKEIRYPLGKIHEDEATTHKLFFEAKKAVFVDKFMYGYFCAQQSITRNSFSKKRLDWAWAVEQRLDFLEEKEMFYLYPRAAKAYIDGVIDLYFKCRENIADSKKEQKELKAKIWKIMKKNQKYGGFEKRTKMGYRIFLLCPVLYKKILSM